MSPSQFAPEELKVIGLAAPIWLRMLREREKLLLGRIYGQYRTPGSEEQAYIPIIAEYAVIRDLIGEIERLRD